MLRINKSFVTIHCIVEMYRDEWDSKTLDLTLSYDYEDDCTNEDIITEIMQKYNPSNYYNSAMIHLYSVFGKNVVETTVEWNMVEA